MIFTLNDPKGPKTMKTLRCFLFSAIVVISSAIFVLGGDMQGPGKSDPTPTPTPTASTNDALTQPTSTEAIQIGCQDATELLVEILLTIY